jgi:hypothetical protein
MFAEMLSEDNNSGHEDENNDQMSEEAKAHTENDKNDQDETDGDLLSKFKSQE